MRLMAIAVGLVAVLCTAAPDARAQASSASCDVYEIEASNDGSGIDSGLSGLKKVLSKPPFNSWTSYKLLKKHGVKLAVGKAVKLSLAAKGALSLELKDVTKGRLRIAVELKNAKGKATNATTRIASGEPFLIGGEPLPGKPKSAYFVGIRCTAP